MGGRDWTFRSMSNRREEFFANAEKEEVWELVRIYDESAIDGCVKGGWTFRSSLSKSRPIQISKLLNVWGIYVCSRCYDIGFQLIHGFSLSSVCQTFTETHQVDDLRHTKHHSIWRHSGQTSPICQTS